MSANRKIILITGTATLLIALFLFVEFFSFATLNQEDAERRKIADAIRAKVSGKGAFQITSMELKGNAWVVSVREKPFYIGSFATFVVSREGEILNIEKGL